MTVILRPSIRLLQTRSRQIPRRLVALVALGMLLWWPLAAPAQSIKINRAQLEYADDGWNLSADLDFGLPNNPEDAVSKGIALCFLVKFELIRPRWYWFDDHTISATCVMRLPYHPPTRQYRVSTGSLQVSFPRPKDTVDFIQHVHGWCVFEQRVAKAGETAQTEMCMRPDVTQLPKPFQINAVNTRDWSPSSEWKRFNLLVLNEFPSAPSPASTALPSSAPASMPPASSSSGLSLNSGWGMGAGPSDSGTLLAPAK